MSDEVVHAQRKRQRCTPSLEVRILPGAILEERMSRDGDEPSLPNAAFRKQQSFLKRAKMSFQSISDSPGKTQRGKTQRDPGK